MSDNSYSFSQDLKEAKAMADALDRYVRHETLYGTVGAGGLFSGGRMPALTVGALLMRLRRLNALSDQLSDSQRQTLAVVETRNRAVHQEWRVHYEGKMTREAHSRLDAMKPFFEECASSPRLCAQVYRPEVLRRTIVEELLIAMQDYDIDSGDVVKKVRAVDGRLRSFVQADEFLWSEVLKPAYPEKQFWWMYNRPQVPEN